MSKKRFSDTKFGSFLTKVGNTGLDVLSIIGKAKGGDILGAISESKQLLTDKPTTERKSLLSELNANQTDFISDYDKYLKDVKDARDMYVETSHEIADEIAMRVINYNLWVVIVMIIIEIITVIYINDKILIAIISGAIGSITTALLQERQQVLNFFFGSSKGSKDKSSILNK